MNQTKNTCAACDFLRKTFPKADEMTKGKSCNKTINMSSNVKYQHIYCPKCGTILSGMIISKPDNPFDVYDAYCPDCDYFITESEWKTVDEYRKLIDSKAAQDVRQ